MAPDLNSVPSSPRNPPITASATTSQQTQTPHPPRHAPAPGSRRASQIYPMNPPPLPLASPGGTIPISIQQGQQAFPPLSPVLTNTSTSSESGPSMPMRHPRPMTPAELHLELEKEQEAVVNRLTRELTALRAHSASVASTASSTSTFDMAASSHPTTSRRHRSSSSASQPYTAIPLSSTTGLTTHSHSQHPHRPSLPTVATQGEPLTSTPSAASRQSSLSAGVPLTPRYEDVALHRQELEDAKRENERLRRRVRELEALVRGRRASSVSVSSAASAGGAGSGGSGSESRERSVSVQRQAAGPEHGTAASTSTASGGATGRDMLRDAFRD